MAMTIEQQKAIAVANARRRAAESESQQPAPTAGTDATQLASQGLSGINEGIATTLGLPVDLTNMALGGAMNAVNAVAGTDFKPAENPIGGRQTFIDLMGPTISPPTDNPTDKFVRNVGENVGATLAPGLGFASKAAKPAAELGKQLYYGLAGGLGAASADAIAPDNPYAGMAGAILGMGAAGGAKALAQKAITPIGVPASRRGAVDLLKQEGVELTAGQKTGSVPLQYTESELGGASAAAFTEKQAQQFTSAALAKAGVRAERATPEVMNKAFDEIGSEFDNLIARSSVPIDAEFKSELSRVMTEYRDSVGKIFVKPAISKRFGFIMDGIKNGAIAINGKGYQSFRTELGKFSRQTTDPEAKQAAQDFISVMDDAVGRYLQQTGRTEDLAAWQQVRSDYRNILAIEDAVSRAGEKAVTGIITPANLRGAVAKMGKRGYVRGQGDLNPLARAGVETMTPLPQSGTTPRAMARAMVSVPAVFGAGAGGAMGNIPGAVMGGLAGAAIPKAAGAAILSGPGRAYLSNNVLSGPAVRASDFSAPMIGTIANLAAQARAVQNQ